MKFKVYRKCSRELPDLYFGVIIGKQIDNKRNIPEIYTLLEQEMRKIENNLREINLKNTGD